MGRLSEDEAWDYFHSNNDYDVNPHDRFLTRVYIEGRNAARDGKPQTPPPEYAGDSLALINWETGYEDWLSLLIYSLRRVPCSLE